MALPRSRPLARGKGLERTGKLKRRRRLARIGRRRRSDFSEIQAFRMGVLDRANGRCERCGQPCAPRDLEAHHLLPRARGGSHDPQTNGAALCRPCHRSVHDHSAPDWSRWLRSRKAA